MRVIIAPQNLWVFILVGLQITKNKRPLRLVTFGLKTSLHVLGERNGMKTELYQTNGKIQGLGPAHFALIINPRRACAGGLQ